MTGNVASYNCGCEPDEAALERATSAYQRMLWIVVGLNAAMFLVGGTVAVIGRTVSVQADALDFLGDALATGIGLILIGRAAYARATMALWQGVVLGTLGLFALGSALYRVVVAVQPAAEAMSVYGALGLAVNVTCAVLLMRFRAGDGTARAVWLYSPNDAFGNVAVLIAAGAVALTISRWPDLAAGTIIAVLFLSSANGILRQAVAERRELQA